MELEESERYCSNCDEHTKHADLGMLPKVFVDDEGKSESTYLNSALCTECTGINFVPVTDEDVEQAYKKYLSALDKYGDVTREELEERVGSDKVPW